MTPSRSAQTVGVAYLCCYLMGVLVLKPGTRIYRLALLPLALYAAFRGATKYDHSEGDAAQGFRNFGEYRDGMEFHGRRARQRAVALRNMA